MATEKQLQEGIQDSVQAIATFANSNVTINEWDLLDQPIANAPYFIIGNADEWLSEQDTVTVAGGWEIPATLVVAFDDWKESLDAFRDARQAIIDKFGEVGTARSAGGYEGVNIRRLRPAGPISYITADPDDNTALPVFITQIFVFEIELF